MKVGSKVYSVFSVILCIISLCMYLGCFMCILLNKSYFIEWEVVVLNGSSVVMSLIFDWMSFSFLGSVCIISSVIVKYSSYYMSGEKNYIRFMFLLLMFVGSMWFLIISPNMISLLLGWDGLGLTSYVLVVFYQSEASCNAGMLTILSNRVGDVAILMSIGIMSYLGSWNYVFMDKASSMLVGLVILASITKSAQVPFSAWLPAAMAAPTPVSALVHSSTLVTAGVYLLIRFSWALEDSQLNSMLLMISTITMLMAGIGANLESDMKKVVALSTLSQLGLMVMTVSVGMPELAFFHLIMHAMFKSSLFMCIGFMIHSMSGAQDSRKMSGLCVSAPLMSVSFGVSNLALAGFPFLAGFYSKDVILELLFFNGGNILVMVVMVLATGLTVSYSLRVMYLGVVSVDNLEVTSGVSDSGLWLIKAMSAVVSASVVFGFFFSWVFFPAGSVALLSGLGKMCIGVISLFMGVVSFYYLAVGGKMMGLGNLYKANSKMWFLPELSSKPISLLSVLYGGTATKVMDLGWMEFYGGRGGHSVFMHMSWVSQYGQRGVMVSPYLFSGVIVMLVLVFIM
uniref:NADH-ubiquinone oxidoreductase chain 5 n=1 Tax=Alicella gigantea TaxID=1315966 RepID=A0A5B7L2Y9_9CRUS|nr:NADH dehydrogenase subunit 5 [Alicella gigantea]QAT19467.1 NADH dehydrogenase subunit 5 [Alicella gigantea]